MCFLPCLCCVLCVLSFIHACLFHSECAGILEGLKQLNDAAEMYVKADQFEKAAGYVLCFCVTRKWLFIAHVVLCVCSIYISLKNFTKAAGLMGRITTPKLHAAYAKAKEAERAYAEAEVAYDKAKDYDSVIRLNLQFLDNPQKAFQLVRTTRSAEGAAMVAKHCIVSSFGCFPVASACVHVCLFSFVDGAQLPRRH